jgi:glycerol uptake facilitator-like aquaporin
MNKYIAEFIGTFTLALVVSFSLSYGNFAVATPILAALVLGVFVYTIGHISGTNINPGVSSGLLSIGKLKSNDFVGYILAQVLAGIIVGILTGKISTMVFGFNMSILFTEMAGMILFTFGIASAVYGRVKDFAGIVVGTSLLLGIALSVSIGGSGVLNPAVAISLGMLDLGYILGPILGAIIGFNLYKFVSEEK